MNIFLIRHGESTQNIYENLQNFPDFKVPLTQNGIDQANKCGEFLKQYCTQNNMDIDNSILLISPFERTTQTANQINSFLNIKNKKFDPIIVERQYGLFDNLKFEEREKYQIAYEYQTWMYSHDVGNFYTKFPLGESNFDVYIRARTFLPTLKQLQQQYQNIFIVSHGGFLKCLEMAYFEYTPQWFTSTPFMDNCAIRLIQDDKNMDYIYKGPKD